MSINGFSFPTPIQFGAGARKLVANVQQNNHSNQVLPDIEISDD